MKKILHQVIRIKFFNQILESKANIHVDEQFNHWLVKVSEQIDRTVSAMNDFSKDFAKKKRSYYRSFRSIFQEKMKGSKCSHNYSFTRPAMRTVEFFVIVFTWKIYLNWKQKREQMDGFQINMKIQSPRSLTFRLLHLNLW